MEVRVTDTGGIELNEHVGRSCLTPLVFTLDVPQDFQVHTTLGNRNILNFNVKVRAFIDDYARFTRLWDIEGLVLVVCHGDRNVVFGWMDVDVTKAKGNSMEMQSVGNMYAPRPTLTPHDEHTYVALV
jgi:hypothetical protein